MLVLMMLRQCELRKQARAGALTESEMVELIGINQILDNDSE